MILGTALYPVFGVKGILFPLMVHAVNLVASFIGVLVVHSREDQDPMDALNRGYYVTTLLALVGYSGADDRPAASLPHVDRRLLEIARALGASKFLYQTASFG